MFPDISSSGLTSTPFTRHLLEGAQWRSRPGDGRRRLVCPLWVST